MYEKKNITYVLTILDSIEKIFIYTDGIETAEDFHERNDQLEFNACQALLLVIGEETKKINDDLKDEHPVIPWKLISGMRNRIAHDYRSIDPNISFDVVKNYLAPLKIELILMLDKIEFEQEFLKRVVETEYYRNLKYLIE